MIFLAGNGLLSVIFTMTPLTNCGPCLVSFSALVLISTERGEKNRKFNNNAVELVLTLFSKHSRKRLDLWSEMWQLHHLSQWVCNFQTHADLPSHSCKCGNDQYSGRFGGFMQFANNMPKITNQFQNSLKSKITVSILSSVVILVINLADAFLQGRHAALL